MLTGTLAKIDNATPGLGWKVALFCIGALSAIGLFYLRDLPTAREWERVQVHVDTAERELAVLKAFVVAASETMRDINFKLDELARERRSYQQPK